MITADLTLVLLRVLASALAERLHSSMEADRFMGRGRGVLTGLCRDDLRHFFRGLPKSQHHFARACLRDSFAALRRNPCETRPQPLSAR